MRHLKLRKDGFFVSLCASVGPEAICQRVPTEFRTSVLCLIVCVRTIISNKAEAKLYQDMTTGGKYPFVQFPKGESMVYLIKPLYAAVRKCCFVTRSVPLLLIKKLQNHFWDTLYCGCGY